MTLEIISYNLVYKYRNRVHITFFVRHATNILFHLTVVGGHTNKRMWQTI